MSMLNIPASIVRKASATVANVASVAVRTGNSVSSTVTGRRTSLDGRNRKDISDYDILVEAKDKVSLHVKSSPSKDAKTTEKLSVKSGYLMKKNEQGQILKRFVCVVPHTFVYYFDSESSDSPRGIIDLELYSNLSLEGNDFCTLKVSTSDESISHIKTFYFHDDDPGKLSEWLTSFHQDRYNIVRDERDAYMQLQEQFSGEIDSASQMIQISSKEKQNMQIDLENAQNQALDSLNTMKRVLVRFGIAENEMQQMDSAARAGDALTKYIDGMQQKFDKILENNEKRHNQEIEQYKSEINQLNNKLSISEINNQNLSNTINKLTNDIEKLKIEIDKEIEKANINISLSNTIKLTLENKLLVANKQKKLLVKEVKLLRDKVDGDNQTIMQLKDLNDRLTSTFTNNQNITPDPSTDLTTNLSSNLTNELSTDLTTKLITRLPSDLSIKSTNNLTSHKDNYFDDEENKLERTSQSSRSEYSDRTSIDQSNQSLSHWQVMNSDTIESPTNSYNYFLPFNNEIDRSIDKSADRLSEKANDKPSDSKITTLMSMFTINKDKSNSSPLLVVDSDNDSNHDDSEFGIGISSTDLTTDLTNEVTTERSNNQTNELSIHTSIQPTSAVVTSPSKEKIICYRCKGTVEGPKYSTCKCLIPALSLDDIKDDVNNNKSIFSMFNKLIN